MMSQGAAAQTRINPPFIVPAIFFAFLFHLIFLARRVEQRNAAAASPYTHISTATTGAVGPETTAFDCNGRGPYVGLSDGRILRWDESTANWTHFTTASPHWNSSCLWTNNDRRELFCGRPLGLKFNDKTCELYFADAYFGLNVVSQYGGEATQLVNMAEGVPFKFTNGVDVDHDTGVVYFTDTSTVYTRLEYEKAIMTKDKTGRLMQYNPYTGQLKVLLRHLAFANGVALSKDKEFLLVAETTTGRIIKYWLKQDSDPNLNRNPYRQRSQVFKQLRGRPDNINRDEDGNFWIAQVPLPPFPDDDNDKSGLKDGDDDDQGLPVKVDESGRVLEVLNETTTTSSEGEEVAVAVAVVVGASDVKSAVGRLWVGSVVYDYVAFKELESAASS